MLRTDPELERISRRISKIDKARIRARGKEREALEIERAELLDDYGTLCNIEKPSRMVQRKAQGPSLSQMHLGPRVQETAMADDDTYLEITGVLASVCNWHHVDVDLATRWASTTDGSVGHAKLGAVLGDLRQELEGRGLLDPKITPVACEDHTWMDYEGNVYTTKRAK
jgi:hypothetical protein